MTKQLSPRSALTAVWRFLWQHKHHVVAILIILLWCLPYFTSGQKIEWGDFGFFSQGYEAIRLSILEYNQFPWFNPWVGGGVPLYANPQFGLFSVQTPLVLLFGAPVGLKLAVVLYTFGGYASMNLLLRRYFKVGATLATLLGLIWILSSFFVAHIPSHFTFVWYLLAPLYIYLALVVKTWQGGLILGGAFAIMALSAVHNPLFHIGSVVAVILLVRLILERQFIKERLLALASAAVIFGIIAGHRLVFVLENVRDFPRELIDPVTPLSTSLLGPFLPFSSSPYIDLAFKNPSATFGFGEVTATIGLFATFAVLLGIIFIIYHISKSANKLKSLKLDWSRAIIALGTAAIFFAIGVGAVHELAPYSFMKYLPILGEMRVSTRWFLGVSLSLIIFIGVVATAQIKDTARRFFRISVYTLLILGVIELFVINFGYQHNFLTHDPVEPNKSTTELTFTQTELFGAAAELPDGSRVDAGEPVRYREYEATLFNTGVIEANDSLVTWLEPSQTPRCTWEQDKCGLVLSGNAQVTYWSPNKMILERTNEGPIELNMNNSNYFRVNDRYQEGLLVAETHKPFIIEDPSQIIIISAQPTLGGAINHLRAD